MDPARYSTLVSELEEAARTHPGSVRRRMFLLIAAGYGYVLGIFLLALAAVAGTLALITSGKASGLALQLLLAAGAFAWAIARSLWVTTPPPEGEVLRLEHAPELARRVEEIRKALSAPRVGAIVLTKELNAAVVQVPRLGIFGWSTTYLVLGIPLMFALDRQQFDAVLAHEFAHLSGSHPKRGLWVYRMSRTWQQLLDRLHATRHWGRKLFQAFVEWYVPRLEAYGFVMSRQDEYQADADAARVTSPAALGGALLALEMRSSAVETFWQDVWASAEVDRTPPARTWSTLPVRLREGVAIEEGVIARVLGRRGDERDTHPSLAARLEALGLPGHRSADRIEAVRPLLAPLERSAADDYLGAIAHDMLSRLDAEWRHRMDEVWAERHEATTANRARLSELNLRDRAGDAFNVEELWELSVLVARFESEDAAESVLRRVLLRAPEHVAAHFALGRLLLARGDARGIEHVERAMQRESDTTTAGCELLQAFYAERDDDAGIARVRRLLYDYQRVVRAAVVERDEVARRDTFVSAGLSAADVAHLEQYASGDSRITRLWIVRKQTTHQSDRPHFVLVVERRWWRLGSLGRNDAQLAEDVVDAVTLPAPCDYLVVVVGAATAWLLKRVRKVPDACVYGVR